MWWITIIITITLVLIAFLFCNRYYARHYGSSTGRVLLSCLHSHEVLYGSIFRVLPNFSNISCNVLLKSVVTIICILIVHLSDSLWVTYLYLAYLLLTYSTFKKRKQHYNAQDSASKEIMKPALVAFSILPVFHTLFMVLLHVAYYLN